MKIEEYEKPPRGYKVHGLYEPKDEFDKDAALFLYDWLMDMEYFPSEQGRLTADRKIVQGALAGLLKSAYEAGKNSVSK